MVYYAPVAPFGAGAIRDNRKLEIKENYNSYNEIGRRNPSLSENHLKQRRCSGDTVRAKSERTSKDAGARHHIAKRIRAHDGCLGIRRL